MINCLIVTLTLAITVTITPTPSLTITLSYNDIKSIDIIFIFLEIVKLTKGKPISLVYFDKNNDIETKIEFGTKYFNYYKISNKIMKFYDSNDRSFSINGYKYTLPSIGVENALTNFLIIKSNESSNIKEYSNYNYDFTYFLADKNFIKFKEIENLIQIFNYDMESDELEKTKSIIKIFSPLQRYSLKKNGKIVEMNSKINLEKIWR